MPFDIEVGGKTRAPAGAVKNSKKKILLWGIIYCHDTFGTLAVNPLVKISVKEVRRYPKPRPTVYCLNAKEI
jgi:hypothetical protein